LNTAASELAIGDRLIYDGSAYVVCGFTPMGVEPARIYLTAVTGRSTHGPAPTVSMPAEALARRRTEREVA
jgi:hypothetical protein